MLQTFGDAIQQIVRIVLYAGAGALVTAGYIDQATSLQLAGAVLTILTGSWTVWWNRRQVVTVDGIKKAVKNPNIPVSGATATEIKAAKRQ